MIMSEVTRAIRLKFSFQGPRPDGTEWPPYDGVLTVGEAEAARLVHAGHAVYLDDEPVARPRGGYSALMPMLDPDRAAAEATETAGGDHELSPEDVMGTSPEDREQRRRPSVRADKAAWVKYAVSQGEGKMEALEMSKADLIAKYGASL